MDGFALRVGMSSRTLARRFHQALGDSPGIYQRKVRMREAQHLLEVTAKPVAEIMVSVGYSDAAAFGRAFKREAGLSPSSYRLKHRTEARMVG